MATLQIIEKDKTYLAVVHAGESLLECLNRYDNRVSAVCGGNGRCGKCKIRVLKGDLPPSEADRAFFTTEQLREGMRLACKAYPSEPLQIAVQFEKEQAFEALSDFGEKTHKGSMVQGHALGLAVDIGTTTIAVQLVDMVSGKALAVYTGVNRQRAYGADVISRITASMQGKGEELQKQIQRDLAEAVQSVTKEAAAEPCQIKEVVLAGNTTMIHLLMGYDCKGLGAYPFTPVNIGQITDSYAHLTKDECLQATAYVLPGISAFVGGDIVSGMYYCELYKTEAYTLFLDLGTNGELVLGNKSRLMTASVAAGPALEGGNITFGVGSIAGAISGVELCDGQTKIRTIADKPPIGICGTGLIEAVAELKGAGFMDETGCLIENFFDQGYPLAEMRDGTKIVLTQADIRQLQLAKAAIRAGIETLCQCYGMQTEDISQVYVAGGFGFCLDFDKAIRIGMLPECFRGKLKAVGNSSLGGAVKFLIEKESRAYVAEIVTHAQKVELAAEEVFNSLYVDAMYF